jgi:hypothetical protein
LEGEWWERIQISSGFELSFFTIRPTERYQSLEMSGDHFNSQGTLIGKWWSVVVGTLSHHRKLFYHWEGEHPPTLEGSASRVQGFGTFQFDHAIGRLQAGVGGFADVDIAHMSDAKWKTVRVKRVTQRKHVQTMTKLGLEAKRTLVLEILREW